MSNIPGKKSNNPFLQATLPTSAGQLAPQELGASSWHETVSIPEPTHQSIYRSPLGPPPQGASSEPPPTYEDISGTAGTQWADIKPNVNTPSVNTQARDPYGSSSGSTRSIGPTPQNMTMPPSTDMRAAFPDQSGYGAPSVRPDINQHYPTSMSQNYPPGASSSSNPLSMNISNQAHSLGTSQPSSFSRPAPPYLPYSLFPPMYLIANDNRLDKGFPLLPPPSALQPHPFATHDVNEEDWTRLVNDLQRTASLSGHERITAGGLGMLVPGGMIPGMIVSRLLKGQMRDNKRKPIGELIDVWNYYFFHPRRLEVILAHGLSREDGGSGPVPSFHSQEMMLPSLGRTSSRSSSSSSSSSDRHSRRGSRMSSKIERRAEKAQRRADRLRERAGRNERRLGRGRGRRDNGTVGDDGLYRLVVIGF